MTVYSDICDMEEDERIKMIGNAIMNAPNSSADPPVMIGVILDVGDKTDRFIKKLAERFPAVRVIDIGPGPVKHTALVRLGGPLR